MSDTTLTIMPGTGAEEFASMLRSMYEAAHDAGHDLSGEHGVHRLVYHPEPQGGRHTVFVAVDAGGDPKDLEWGKTRRSYVLAPYRMVTDHLTGKSTEDVDVVFAGNLSLLS